MPNNSDTDGFEKYLGVLKGNLQYVEDDTFSWNDTLALLIIKLRNTDSLNKVRSESNATQIQLTSERDASEGKRKTEDFFPTLNLFSVPVISLLIFARCLKMAEITSRNAIA